MRRLSWILFGVFLAVAGGAFAAFDDLVPSGGGSGLSSVTVTAPLTGAGTVASPLSAAAFAPLAGATYTGDVSMGGNDIFLDGGSLCGTTSRRVCSIGTTLGHWLVNTSPGVSMWDLSSAGATLAGNMTYDKPGTDPATITYVDGATLTTSGGGTITIPTDGAGTLSVRRRITNSVGPIGLGAATTPTSGYGDANDVQIGGDLESSGKIKAGGAVLGAATYAVDATIAPNNYIRAAYIYGTAEIYMTNDAYNNWDYNGNFFTSGYVLSGGNLGNNTIRADAIMQASSTTKGFLPPRMTTAQRLAISNAGSGSVHEGLIVYDLTTHKSYTHDGSTWQPHF